MTSDPPSEAIDAIIIRALEEDVGTGDVTTLATVPADRMANGSFVVKDEGVIAGLEVAARVFAHLDDRVHVSWHLDDGARARRGTRLGTVEGPARALLTGERVALNLLQRMSGIATATRLMVDAAAPARVLDTRKTAPGLRVLDKWAVRLGGGQNHRHGLYDRILIKDNHIAAAGGIRAAIAAARRFRDDRRQNLLIQIETRTLDEVEEVLLAGHVDWVLLDNMVRLHDDGRIEVGMLQAAVSRIGGRFTTEASGNITLETAAAVAATGVDYLSVGALTHSVQALDIALQLSLRGGPTSGG